MKIKIIAGLILIGAISASTVAVPAHAASVPRRIDGVPVKPGQENPWIIGVMLDNAYDSGGKQGISAASVVYETLAEGGVPRLMALFARRSVPSIGPVRSVRPYFADLAAEYRAAVAHAGGSPDGLRRLGTNKLFSIEGIKGKTARAFFRKRGYFSPHNLFTTGALLLRELTAAHLASKHPPLTAWKFESEPKLAQRPTRGAALTVNFRAGAAYKVQYRYNRRTNVFERSQGGRPFRDANGGSLIAPKNVLVLLVPKEKVLDRKGRLSINVLGRGKGILLRNGVAQTIRWYKPTPSRRTELTTEKGKPIALTRGQTWIEVVPKGHTVSVR